MNQQELKEKYYELYSYMAQSKDPKNMKMFGWFMNEMMEDLIASSPNKAEAWIQKLEAIKWRNYLTPSEADKIVAAMEPKAPWTREQWNTAMQNAGFDFEEWPYYNRCALYAVMQMIMSDSSATLTKYVAGDKMFEAVHALAVDKLTDPDKRFSVRSYFGLQPMDDRNLMILRELEDIRRRQSWWLDLSSNVAGNIIYEGAAYLLRGLFRKL